jgi:hypothetical protein
MSTPETNNEEIQSQEVETKESTTPKANNNELQTPSWLKDAMLPTNFSNTIGGVKLPTKPSFGKLNKHRFSRVHPSADYKFPALIVEDKEAGEEYIATYSMASHLGVNATPKLLRLAVDNSGVPKIIAEPIPNLSGRPNLWNTSMIEAIAHAEKKWVRIESDMSAQQYRIIIAVNELGEPEWPKQSMAELIAEVFNNKVISTEEHPYIKQLAGRI